MKKFLVAFALLLSGWTALLSAPAVVSAVDVLNPVCSVNNAPTVCKDNQTNGTNPIFGPSGILTKVMSILARVIGFLAVIGVIIAGAMMLFANGDSGQAATARKALIYSLIGLVIAATSQTLVSFVLQKVGS